MTEVFELDVPLIAGKAALTSNQRLHWSVKAKRTRLVREHVGWRAIQAKIGAQDHIVVQLHYFPPDRRRRDPSNLMPTQKPAVDGLVDANVIPDDVPRYVTELMPVIHEPSYGVARMHLQVRPVPKLSDEDREWIESDSKFERTQDASDRGTDEGEQ